MDSAKDIFCYDLYHGSIVRSEVQAATGMGVWCLSVLTLCERTVSDDMGVGLELKYGVGRCSSLTTS